MIIGFLDGNSFMIFIRARQIYSSAGMELNCSAASHAAQTRGYHILSYSLELFDAVCRLLDLTWNPTRTTISKEKCIILTL